MPPFWDPPHAHPSTSRRSRGCWRKRCPRYRPLPKIAAPPGCSPRSAARRRPPRRGIFRVRPGRAGARLPPQRRDSHAARRSRRAASCLRTSRSRCSAADRPFRLRLGEKRHVFRCHHPRRRVVSATGRALAATGCPPARARHQARLWPWCVPRYNYYKQLSRVRDPMPLQERPRLRTSSRPALDLPPPFRLVTLREVGDAFAHATRVAAEEGAGTLVHVGRFDLAEFAVVVEPDERLRTARRAFYVGMNALGDALAAHAPPEKPISFVWPDAIRVDGALVGGGRLAWPAGADENDPPAWLVFGAMIRTIAMGEGEPGLRPLSGALEDEGFDDLGSGRLIESFTRHLMV